ncbi:MAG: class I SAM-dependent methyltransferase [Deferrisomatales bacterium]
MDQVSDKARKIRDRIRGNFDRGAHAYERFEAETAFFQGLLRQLLALLPPGALRGARVLDVGCGTGASLAELCRAVGPAGQAVGIDISAGMLRQARARLGEGVPLAVMDGCGFGRGLQGAFDAVVYNAVLFMLPDPAGSLASARAILRPGGAVLLSFLEGVRLPDRGCTVNEWMAERGLPVGRHAVADWPQVEGRLREGFEQVAVRRVQIPLTPERFAGFYGMEPMSAGLLPRLPYAERKEAVEATAAQCRAEGVRIEQAWLLAVARNGSPAPTQDTGRGAT